MTTPALPLLWPTPKATEMGFISPTALSTLQTCQLRLAFQRDDKTRVWMRKSTSSALGVAAHRLTELVLKGAAPTDPADRRTWLTERWEGLVHAEWESIQAQWPDRIVDEPKHWGGEVATRVRLIKRLQAVQVRNHSVQVYGAPSGSAPAKEANATNRQAPAFPWIERKLYDDDRGLFGQPDRVEDVDGYLRVLDLKSGVRQGAMTETQLQQLLLYAHLVHVSVGRLPYEVVLQDVRGIEQSSAVSVERVEGIVELAVQARALFNDAVVSGDFTASPSDDACGFCPFRVICADYWDTRDDDWSGHAVRGTVIAVGIDGLSSSQSTTRRPGHV